MLLVWRLFVNVGCLIALYRAACLFYWMLREHCVGGVALCGVWYRVVARVNECWLLLCWMVESCYGCTVLSVSGSGFVTWGVDWGLVGCVWLAVSGGFDCVNLSGVW